MKIEEFEKIINSLPEVEDNKQRFIVEYPDLYLRLIDPECKNIVVCETQTVIELLKQFKIMAAVRQYREEYEVSLNEGLYACAYLLARYVYNVMYVRAN